MSDEMLTALERQLAIIVRENVARIKPPSGSCDCHSVLCLCGACGLCPSCCEAMRLWEWHD